MTLYRFRGSVPPSPRASIVTVADDDTTATLRLYDPIDSWGGEWGVSAKEFAAALDALPVGVERIVVQINSPGGEVWEGLAITNQLRRHPATVTAVVDGIAASAASFIAVGGADRVVMGRNAQMMIHDAWGMCMGNAADMRELGDRLDKISDNVASIYAERAGGDVSAWRAAMLRETWYNADEAVAAGLAVDVEDVQPADDARASFDLAAFRHAGRNAAPSPVLPAAASVEYDGHRDPVRRRQQTRARGHRA